MPLVTPNALCIFSGLPWFLLDNLLCESILLLISKHIHTSASIALRKNVICDKCTCILHMFVLLLLTWTPLWSLKSMRCIVLSICSIFVWINGSLSLSIIQQVKTSMMQDEPLYGVSRLVCKSISCNVYLFIRYSLRHRLCRKSTTTIVEEVEKKWWGDEVVIHCNIIRSTVYYDSDIEVWLILWVFHTVLIPFANVM